MGLRRWRSADDPQRTLDRGGTVTQGLGDARPPPDAQGGEQAVTQGCQSLGRVPFGCLAVVFAQGLITHIVSAPGSRRSGGYPFQLGRRDFRVVRAGEGLAHGTALLPGLPERALAGAPQGLAQTGQARYPFSDALLTEVRCSMRPCPQLRELKPSRASSP